MPPQQKEKRKANVLPVFMIVKPKQDIQFDFTEKSQKEEPEERSEDLKCFSVKRARPQPSSETFNEAGEKLENSENKLFSNRQTTQETEVRQKYMEYLQFFEENQKLKFKNAKIR